jgi:alkanesulfonate monooxygenase SsuD/methylene tetrahydromethanopterin reductase-like flavin-dependent oxidoreductase (luciferase family)
VHLLRTAERGLFDFLFLAEGLRLREHRGRIYDLDVVGRPDTFRVLDALAGITNRLGPNGTTNTTFNEPFEVARQFAGIDHLSDGRDGWNMVTSSDAFTGANFRRGSLLDHSNPVAVARMYRERAEAEHLSIRELAGHRHHQPAAIRRHRRTSPTKSTDM